MIIDGSYIDTSKLMSKDELLSHLRENGESDAELVSIRERYHTEFGKELCWHYPIVGVNHVGATIVAVKEGFLCLPCDSVEKERLEVFDVDNAYLLTVKTVYQMTVDFEAYSCEMLRALRDMLLASSDEPI